ISLTDSTNTYKFTLYLHDALPILKHNPDFISETERMKHELMEQWVLDYFFSSSGDYYEILYKDELIDESFDYQSTVEEALNFTRSEEHTSELQSRFDLVCRLLLEK